MKTNKIITAHEIAKENRARMINMGVIVLSAIIFSPRINYVMCLYDLLNIGISFISYKNLRKLYYVDFYMK